MTDATHGPSDFQCVLMRPSCETHHQDFEAAWIELQITGTTVVDPQQKIWGFQVTTPPNHTFTPPGYYMLFLLETGSHGPSYDKVPSVAAFVQVL